MSDHILDALNMAAPYGPAALAAVERYIRSLPVIPAQGGAGIAQPVNLTCVKLVINNTVGSNATNPTYCTRTSEVNSKIGQGKHLTNILYSTML